MWTGKVEQSILANERAKEMKGMAKNQKSYTPEFKQQIVDLYNAGGTSYPQLKREYGVNRSTISGWVKQLSPIKVSDEETVTLKEYKALQKVGVTEDVPGDLSKKTIRRPASAGRFCVGTSDNVMKNIVVEECNICYN